MAAAARRAIELETDTHSPYYAVAHTARGHSAYIAGDLALACHHLSKASQNEAASPIIRVLSLSLQSLAEAEQGHDRRSGVLADQAMDLVESQGLHAMPQASLAFTAFAQAKATADKLSEAMEAVDHGLALRRTNPGLAPWATFHHLLVAARVAADAGELSSARQHLHEASTQMDRFPNGMQAMRARLGAVHKRMRSSRIPAQGEPLTERELEVLGSLAGSMSLGEIAGELFVSTNTVKTHTKALYRKLGARSRTEAVRLGQDRWLI
jgi:LuxR family maltose regulon positive regulatory protein